MLKVAKWFSKHKGQIFKSGLFCVAIVFIFSTWCLAGFRFAVIGDTRGYDDGINTKVFKKILEQVRSDKAEFIIVIGDLVTGSVKGSTHRERFLRWKTIVEGYGFPVYIVVGNHEIESEISENILRSVFEMPHNGPSELDELTYSFDYKNVHFVVLDTDVYGQFHRVGKIQLDWLKDDLRQNRKKVIFVFGHEPAYPVSNHKRHCLDRFPSERDKLWRIFQKNKIYIYFTAHEHLYYKSVHGQVLQIITGGGGAPLHAPPEGGGFYHYVIVDVKDNGVCEVSVKDLQGNIKDIFNWQ